MRGNQYDGGLNLYSAACLPSEMTFPGLGSLSRSSENCGSSSPRGSSGLTTGVVRGRLRKGPWASAGGDGRLIARYRPKMTAEAALTAVKTNNPGPPSADMTAEPASGPIVAPAEYDWIS